MVKIIGVRFRTAGKIYFFDPMEYEIKRGDYVIVETARGIEFGTVVTGVTEVPEEKVVQPLKPVIRIANRRDMEQEAENREKEKEAFRICVEKIHSHGLEMKLIDAEYTFDNNKVLFYFTADGRIDFRELVKDLAGVFRTRIELRQIGVRDETKIVGGIGICGRPLCCHSYLGDFVPVSIKMAKEQNLSLNPAKISGVCGRLMCCLKNEEETYEELNRRLPNIGDEVTMEGGAKGEVHSVNVLRQLVKVVVDAGDEKEIKEFPVEKLHFRRKHSKKEKMELSQEELEELERLEEEEWQKKEEENAAKAMEEQRQNGRNRRKGAGPKEAEPRRGEGKGEENGSYNTGNEGKRRFPPRGGNARQNGRQGEWQGLSGSRINEGQESNARRAEPRGFGDGRMNDRPTQGGRLPDSNVFSDGRLKEGQNLSGKSGGGQANEGQCFAGKADGGQSRGGMNGRQGSGSGENRKQGQEGSKPRGQRYNNGQKHPGQRQDRNAMRMEAGSDAFPVIEQRPEGRNRRDNRKRQDNRGQRNGQEENGTFQSGRNRYDNRNRRDARQSQNGSSGGNSGQAEKQ